MSLSKEQLMLEYVRCMKDTPYALRTYLQTYDNTVSRYVPLELFPDQVSPPAKEVILIETTEGDTN